MVVRGGLPNDRCGQLSRLRRDSLDVDRFNLVCRPLPGLRQRLGPVGRHEVGVLAFGSLYGGVPRVAHGPPNRLVALGCRDPLAARKARRAALVVLAPLSGEADGVVRCSDRIEHVAGGVRAIGAVSSPAAAASVAASAVALDARGRAMALPQPVGGVERDGSGERGVEAGPLGGDGHERVVAERRVTRGVVAVALGALSAADEHDRGVDVAGRERDVDAGGHFVLRVLRFEVAADGLDGGGGLPTEFAVALDIIVGEGLPKPAPVDALEARYVEVGGRWRESAQ